MDQRLLDYMPLLEAFGAAEFEREAGRAAQTPAPPFDDAAEYAFAAELLSVPDARGLQRFLRMLAARAGGGRAGAADGIAPLAHLLGQAGGSLLRALGHGGHARPDHAALARAAQAFGLELEGLSPEDREFALARQFVRFAGRAFAARAATPGVPPDAAARAAFERAAREYAPGLLARFHPGAAPAAGRWVRRGGRIAVLDC